MTPPLCFYSSLSEFFFFSFAFSSRIPSSSGVNPRPRSPCSVIAPVSYLFMTIPPIYFLLSSCLVSCVYLLMLDTGPIIPPSKKSVPRAPPKKEHPTNPTIAYPRPLNMQPTGDFCRCAICIFLDVIFQFSKIFFDMIFYLVQTLKLPITFSSLSFYYLIFSLTNFTLDNPIRSEVKASMKSIIPNSLRVGVLPFFIS